MVIAMHLVEDAVAVLDEMATFVEAGVSEKEPDSERSSHYGARIVAMVAWLHLGSRRADDGSK